METNDDLDPVFASDRNRGSTAPETAEQSSNIVGRPPGGAGFHEAAQTDAQEREPFTESEALKEGASFHGLGVPVADDSSD
jgi:hypothetical protein